MGHSVCGLDSRLRAGKSPLSSFGHHGREVPIAEAVCQVPADALFDELRTVATATIDGVAGRGFGHVGARKRPRS